jgi:methyl-accepting chemotaxis protein
LNVEATTALKIATLGLVGVTLLAVGAIALFITKLIDQANAEKQAEENNKKVNETYEERIEILDKTKTAAEEVKKAFDDMTESAKKYGEAREALAGMEKGTEAYRDKVKEANEAARELIETMGLTLGKGYDIVDGEYIINKGSSEYKAAYADQ